jgi:hypothetical protein
LKPTILLAMFHTPQLEVRGAGGLP